MNIQTLYSALLRKFGPQGWWPLTTQAGKQGYDERGYHPSLYTPHQEEHRLEISIGAILTQNTSWTNVEKAILNLKKEKLLNRQALQKITEEKLAQLIRSAGYFNQKARKLKTFISFNKPLNRENLLSIWGIGKETADSILCYAYQQPTFVVDAYTQRIFQRMGYQEQGYDAIQQKVMQELSTAQEYNEFHALLVELAKRHCTKTKPTCSSCPLTKSCKKLIEASQSS